MSLNPNQSRGGSKTHVVNKPLIGVGMCSCVRALAFWILALGAGAFNRFGAAVLVAATAGLAAPSEVAAPGCGASTIGVSARPNPRQDREAQPQSHLVRERYPTGWKVRGGVEGRRPWLHSRTTVLVTRILSRATNCHGGHVFVFVQRPASTQ